MRKTILTFIILNLLFVAIAQEEQTALVSKKGIPILPESGEFSIGINAAPFFRYAGNIFNGTQNNGSPGFTFTAENPFMITGKYMLSANTAVRGIFRLGFGSEKTIGDVTDDVATTVKYVEDTYKTSYLNIGIGGGIEKRRGKGRLQGIYGGQAIILLKSGKDTYDYANAFSTTNTTPTRTDFGSNDLGGGQWATENKSGLGFGVQVQGFVGAEFFFAPKFSLSGEFTYGLGFMNQAKGSETVQSWTGTAIQSTTRKAGGSSAFGLDTGVGAFLNLNFYF
jgi:hypothetical protein